MHAITPNGLRLVLKDFRFRPCHKCETWISIYLKHVQCNAVACNSSPFAWFELRWSWINAWNTRTIEHCWASIIQVIDMDAFLNFNLIFTFRILWSIIHDVEQLIWKSRLADVRNNVLYLKFFKYHIMICLCWLFCALFILLAMYFALRWEYYSPSKLCAARNYFVQHKHRASVLREAIWSQDYWGGHKWLKRLWKRANFVNHLEWSRLGGRFFQKTISPISTAIDCVTD